MFKGIKRQSVSNDTRSKAEIAFLPGYDDFPLLVKWSAGHAEGTEWIEENKAYLLGQLQKYGSVVFRGFGVSSIDRLRDFSMKFTNDLVPYKERRSRRTELGDKVYTSTVHPADQWIHFHNTTSFSHQWPMKLWFACLKPSPVGGRTPLADTRKVLAAIGDKTREKFRTLGVRYVRNFYKGVGLSWQSTFQTEDRADVERYCVEANIDFDWLDGGERLKTVQIRHATATHPVVGTEVWFNQAHHFHVDALEPNISAILRDRYVEEELPRHAGFGDGSPIEKHELEDVIRAYKENEVSFDWETGDVIMIDNMLAAHARMPYSGERLIALTLAEMYQLREIRGGVAY